MILQIHNKTKLALQAIRHVWIVCERLYFQCVPPVAIVGLNVVTRPFKLISTHGIVIASVVERVHSDFPVHIKVRMSA